MTEEKEKEKEPEELKDPRFDFISNFVLKSLRLKSDKWSKMISTEDFREIVMNFLKKPKYDTLIFQMNAASLLQPSYTFPPRSKTKVVFFVKKEHIVLEDAKSVHEDCIHGDLVPNNIRSLSVFVDDMLVPMLENKENQVGWTSVMKTDVGTECQNFRHVVSQLKGNMINRTILPLPTCIEEVMELSTKIAAGDLTDFSDKMKDSLESIAMKWLDSVSELVGINATEKVFTMDENPRPEHLFEFWKSRLENLEDLTRQIGTTKVQTVGFVLEKIKSNFVNTFKNMVCLILEALEEARDITINLSPLKKIVDKFEGVEIDENRDKIRPLVLTVGLVWSYSKHFSTVENISLLFQLLHNTLIESSSKTLAPDNIFQGEIDEALNRVNLVEKILNYYRTVYEDIRSNLRTKFSKSLEANPTAHDWSWQPETIFSRLELFKKRLKELRSIFEIGIEFNKLDKIQIGGLKGRYITIAIENIFEEFSTMYRKWSTIAYNPLDLNPDAKQFRKDRLDFLKKMTILQRRLAYQFEIAFEESHDLILTLQMMELCGNLLHLPIIKKRTVKLANEVIGKFVDELKNVKMIFDEYIKIYNEVGIEGVLVDANYPQVSGMLIWLNNLRMRVRGPYNEFPLTEYTEIFESDEAKEAMEKYYEMTTYFAEIETKVMKRWKKDVINSLQIGMEKPLLRKENCVIFENFDDKLKIAMKDIRYISLMKYLIPPEAISLIDVQEKIWAARIATMRIAEWYNEIKSKGFPCEFALIQKDIEEVDVVLEPNFYTVLWHNFDSAGLDEVVEKVKKLHLRLMRTQHHIEMMKRKIQSWGNIPFYQRKDGNSKALLDTTDRQKIKKERYLSVLKTKTLIHKLMNLSLKLFFKLPDILNWLDNVSDNTNVSQVSSIMADTTVISTEFIETQSEFDERLERSLDDLEDTIIAKNDEEIEKILNSILSEEDQVNFEEYRKHVDGIILDALIEALKNSFKYLRNEIENRTESNFPLMMIAQSLSDKYIICTPSIELNVEDGFIAFVQDLCEDIFLQAAVITKLSHETEYITFYEDVRADPNLNKMEVDIMSKVKQTLSVVRNYLVKEYVDKNYIWMYDKKQYLDDIKTYGRLLNESERMGDPSERPKPIRDDVLPLEIYQQQIEDFMILHEEISLEWNTYTDFAIWLRLEQTLFKDKVLQEIEDWVLLFKNDLINKVKDALQDLDDFVTEAAEVLKLEIDKEDFDGLMRVMVILNRVNEKQFAYDEMFEPLRDIVELLKSYNYKFPEKVFIQFNELPTRWMRVKKNAATTKQVIAPIQAYQTDLHERRIILFHFRMTLFRKQFLERPFLKVPCSNPYSGIDSSVKDIVEVESAYFILKDAASMLSASEPDISKLARCRYELKLLKVVWDFYASIESTIENWKKTAWKKIDVEIIDAECKRFQKELRGLHKDMRGLDPYIQAEANIKNLMTAIKAINELQNPAIKDRHWVELMETTKVKFELVDSTTLADLLALNLHHFEDDVRNIVDKSVKEAVMEKALFEISRTWYSMAFGYDVHERTGVKLLKASEEIVETLEDHQSQLQNMLGSKFVGYFFEQVSSWQVKLSNADQVITAWFEVQRKWQYLESIFIGSEDIRNQLPDDSRRFDIIDRDFRILISAMNADRNIVRATNKPNLFDRLESINAQLVLCEKALNDYLETKRLAYPRFYFVSSADLLDILSNGNKPLMVAKHLTKLYDSLGKLEFPKDSKLSRAMIAKELEERVAFVGACDCDGNVEIWLNRVTDKMRETLRNQLRRSVIAYEDKPRHVWLFDWPAQPALVATQIWWTAEVNDAFSKFEKGYENALKDYNRKQVNQLNNLINLLLGDLSAAERQKIMTVCTIDVHSRDVVGKIITQRVEQVSAFQWQSQLRHRWDMRLEDCFANICDAEFRYDYEYLGNTPRLVITPLTDRCYITLTQSLHLIMSGAPAGPAGTGKTETTKDLGRALGMMVYVFNCSEQMDYKSCGDIHKGLAQSGAWGCFDEFNRIAVEVLSVIAVQVKTIQDAIKAKKITFNFLGEIINLRPTVGMFITMNPGYAGRAELPENLKALYRPCAMVVPDFALICEIMLVAEAFQEARLLARKFITLYTLCKELLSKQDHYDWGLRAIKSVLVVAGALRRDDRFRPEDQVLMRALRDFNIPKIVTDDVPVFMGLIGDLFPALDVPRKRLPEFEAIIKKSAIDTMLQPEDGFILKVVQLEELFAVRHSVFIIGFAGTGKSTVWKTLNKTYQNQKRKPMYNDINPKTVTPNELFGTVNPATREWKDGLFSIIMRDQANLGTSGPKWIVLDGDIDPMWIESLNTLMDDNKILTLASNERIALTKEMRLLFEIYTLRVATPATVSRAGILYINPQDLGWSPFVTSWITARSNSTEMSILTILFEKYIPPMLEMFKGRLKKITPISDIAMIQMTCFLLECLLTPQNLPQDSPKDWYEIYFVFAIIWGFGSTLFQDQIVDWRLEFHKWWSNEFKSVKFPSNGSVFNFYVDHETKKFLPWTNLVPNFELDPDIPLQSNLVNTSETTRIRYFMDILIETNHPVMLIGPPGSGKTIMMNAKLSSLPDKYAVTNVPLNFYTTSEMLQRVLEKPLEKKAGRNFGPPGNKKMIYFVDDMNMPEVDKYFTVQPHTLIRQFMDYKHWYDRVKMSLKDIHNCLFVSCMNPFAGSFTINPRLQRHFCSFAVNAPGVDSLYHILYSILSQHLAFPQHKFSDDVKDLCPLLITTAIGVHQKVASSLLPTAIKFHYNFNLRDIANIFTGMLTSNFETCPNPNLLLRLWVHEATRVYGDKLVEIEDIKLFNKILLEQVRKGIENFGEDVVFAKPLVYCHFAKGLSEMKYTSIIDWVQLNKILNEAQEGYNDLVGALNLVLFEDAMSHICRISRILESPRGYALLIGVGGSGKQSLTRLASFISSLDVFQIQLSKDYSIADLRININFLYIKAGVKTQPNCFLMTDSEVAKEEFLVVINDLLASGEVPELFADDEVENIINAIRNEVKQQGIPDTRENCWKYFIEKVRGSLKVVLCFSPVGSTLRVRARKFPALINCTTIDWFHEWPQEALESVSYRFLSEFDTLPIELATPISQFMAAVHNSVNDISQLYLANDKRYNYTTPKSFLELISLYIKLLGEKFSANKERVRRLENGLIKLASCTEEVDSLQDVLKDQEVVLLLKNEAADKLVEKVSTENEKVQKERLFATEEEKKVRIIEEEVTEVAAVCEEDYRKAQPALLAAQEALNTLNKTNLTELKSFGSPPEAVINVCAAVLVLFSSKGKIPKDRSWKACRGLMGNVDKFLNDLITYDKEHIQADVIKALQQYVRDPEFDPEKIMAKSAAAAGLCAWVVNIHRFYEVFLIVEPKLRALTAAQNTLKDARDKLTFLNNRLIELEEQLMVIQAEFDAAMGEKQKCQDEADKTAFTIDLAHRLISGMATEKVRWAESVKGLKENQITLPGDILLISCFISYVGCFTRPYRRELQSKLWLPTFNAMQPKIPATEGSDPFEMICDDAQIAEWNNQGLPSDRMSAENAAILVHSERYPLMIDPQLQGIKWVKQKYAREMVIIRLAQRGYLDIIEKAVRNGNVLLIENIGETVDAVLNPLLGRSLIKKGTCLKIGDKEIDFNPKFRLILHTKLANPHYKPEMQAQCTLINFTVTRDGLEEQLLAEVVKAERPDLEALRSKLTQQQNYFKITLKFLEDDLLRRLASAGDNVLEDVDLVLNLEKTKKTADEIEVKVVEAKITAVQIDSARESYRLAAERASIIYFVLNELFKINPIYQFSLKAFTVVFGTAISRAVQSEIVRERVEHLVDSMTFSSFMYTSRGLFEADKLIFLTQMTLQILINSKEIDTTELDFLLRFPYYANLVSPVPFLTHTLWGGIRSLSSLAGFRGLDKDIEISPKRWKKFVDSDNPEKERLPGEWKLKSPLQRLCIMRCLRPDRMTYAMRGFIEEKMGSKYVSQKVIEFSKTFEETSPETHIFFVLSAGVDPLKDVEKLGKVMGFHGDNENFHNVSLGQGQEIIAENAIDISSKLGHWVILQNIHLVEKWLPRLEKSMEATYGNSNANYRLFLSAEPAGDPAYHILPQAILESAVKITNEPPTGMQANIHKALDNFSQETLEMCTKETEFKAVLFSLCYFHAVMAERRKFGPQGWNRVYPFNVGDLTISVYVLYNYLEANNRVPWEDLRYLFGEIMYGGHITDDWDRRLCRTYLEEFMQQELIDGELFYATGFPAPGILNYDGYHNYIDAKLPAESPNLYGLHLNAEIGFLTTVSARLFRIVFELQPRMTSGGGSGEATQDEVVRNIVEETLDKIPPPFKIVELMAKIEDRDPYIIVAFQECERMNMLMREIFRSLKELELGLKGELTISSIMEVLMESLFKDMVHESWTKLAYPSTLGFQSWLTDLLIRFAELQKWVSDFKLPSSVWLAGFFNPQSFLTAIMQQTARKNEWPLDRMCLNCEVTKKNKDDINAPPREGAFVNGLFMEGARWDSVVGTIADAFMKELFPAMPVIYIKAVTQDKQDVKNIYECPVYKIRMRGPTYVWTFNLKSKEKAAKWTLAGVCLLLQP